MVELLWKTQGGSSKKLNVEISYNPEIPLLGMQADIRQGVSR